jgi:hypothetical protein
MICEIFVHLMAEYKIIKNKLERSFWKKEYTCAPESTGNTFEDLPRLRETADNTERYI